MSDLPNLPAGVYRHYKGPLYLVLGYGHDANFARRDVVVYVGLELNQAKTGPRLAVRTFEDFFFGHMHARGRARDQWEECVSWCDRKDLHVPRFDYVGSTYEGQR